MRGKGFSSNDGIVRLLFALFFVRGLFGLCSGQISCGAIDEQKNKVFFISCTRGLLPAPGHLPLELVGVFGFEEVVVGDEVAQGAADLLLGVGLLGA